ncbi:MAG: DEAD/DEAH box helicase [Candidatus Firestonebacteria bacterium]|nr:DEAD/DEAH box helicase [Candidatus Firestonebacteria bacterium]
MNMNNFSKKIDNLNTSIQYIKGVGPQRAMFLKKLGITCIHDLLYFFPRDYDDRQNIIPINKLSIGQKAVIHGKVLSAGEYIPRSGSVKHIFKIILGDNSGFIEAIWFNQPYLKNIFKKDSDIILIGKIEYNKFHRLQINSPEYEIIEPDDESEDSLNNNVNSGRIVPIYNLTEGLTQKFLRKTINILLNQYAHILPDIIPENIKNKYNFYPLLNALNEIHFPSSFDVLKKARERLIYEEFFILELGLAKRRAGIKTLPGISFNINLNLITGFTQSLPFELTSAQKKVLKEIFDDMQSSRPMLRLLEGDVGSGKTIIAIFAMLASYANGYQSAIMAPTEILAEQHYNTFCRLLKNTDIKIAFLAGKTKKSEKDKLYEAITSGEINILVGTHALIEEKVNFQKLGFVVIDEQHRFGVIQRNE